MSLVSTFGEMEKFHLLATIENLRNELIESNMAKASLPASKPKLAKIMPPAKFEEPKVHHLCDEYPNFLQRLEKVHYLEMNNLIALCLPLPNAHQKLRLNIVNNGRYAAQQLWQDDHGENFCSTEFLRDKFNLFMALFCKANRDGKYKGGIEIHHGSDPCSSFTPAFFDFIIEHAQTTSQPEHFVNFLMISFGNSNQNPELPNWWRKNSSGKYGGACIESRVVNQNGGENGVKFKIAIKSRGDEIHSFTICKLL